MNHPAFSAAKLFGGQINILLAGEHGVFDLERGGNGAKLRAEALDGLFERQEGVASGDGRGKLAAKTAEVLAFIATKEAL